MHEIFEQIATSTDETNSKDGKHMREIKRTKRFYQTVAIRRGEDGFHLLLDNIPVKTPARREVIVPDEELAQLIAQEFAQQIAFIDPSTMPITRIINTVIDGVADDPQPVFEDILRFANSDLLFYRARMPEALVKRQADLWDPVIEWAETYLAVSFNVGAGITPIEQPQSAMIAFSLQLRQFSSPFALAAFHTITALTGSALIALATAKDKLDLEQAWKLAHVDEDWTAEIWGVDKEAQARRSFRQQELAAAATILKQLQR